MNAGRATQLLLKNDVPFRRPKGSGDSAGSPYWEGRSTREPALRHHETSHSPDRSDLLFSFQNGKDMGERNGDADLSRKDSAKSREVSIGCLVMLYAIQGATSCPSHWQSPQE